MITRLLKKFKWFKMFHGKLLLAFFLTPSLVFGGAKSRQIIGMGLQQSDIAAINMNFDKADQEDLNSVHTSSTETIHGFKYFKDPVSLTTATLSLQTASRATVTDANKNIITSAVTSTEIGYVSGVTSAIQTQINNTQPLNSNLTAISGLTSAENKVPVFTGSGTAQVRDMVEVGSFVPTFSAGIGTVTSTECYYAIIGKTMVVWGKATTGTVAASVATMTIPQSKSHAFTATTSQVGKGTRQAANGDLTIIADSSSPTTIGFAPGAGSATPLTVQNGSVVFGNSERFSFFCVIPIQ